MWSSPALPFRCTPAWPDNVPSLCFILTPQVGVGKWLKKLETVFYSSGIGLDKVLSGESKESFTDVILKNYFGDDASKRGQASILAKYVQRELHCLQVRDLDT